MVLVQKAAFAFSTLVTLYKKTPAVLVETGIVLVKLDVVIGVCATGVPPFVDSV